MDIDDDDDDIIYERETLEELIGIIDQRPSANEM